MVLNQHWRLISFCATVCILWRRPAEAAEMNELSPLGRGLEDSAGYEVDISKYSVRFETCQNVKMYSDEVAEDEDSETVFAHKNFIVYRLCPTDECSSCEENYGEYVVPLEDYLEGVVQFQNNQFDLLCNNCEVECDDADCDNGGCGSVCYQYANLEDSGYVDASEYIECREVDRQEDDDEQGGDDDDFALYAGPKCTSDGTGIKIGLFTDENCWEPYEDQDAEDVLGGELSYYFIRTTYQGERGSCISCKEQEDDNNEADKDDVDDVNELCEDVYSASGKCESVHGIYGFVQMNREEQDFENQVESEFSVCNFIESLVLGSYTEAGEINIEDEQDIIYREVTKLQMISLGALTFTILSFIGCAMYLHKTIANSYPNADLASTGGTLS